MCHSFRSHPDTLAKQKCVVPVIITFSINAVFEMSRGYCPWLQRICINLEPRSPGWRCTVNQSCSLVLGQEESDVRMSKCQNKYHVGYRTLEIMMFVVKALHIDVPDRRTCCSSSLMCSIEENSGGLHRQYYIVAPLWNSCSTHTMSAKSLPQFTECIVSLRSASSWNNVTNR